MIAFKGAVNLKHYVQLPHNKIVPKDSLQT